MDLAGELTAVQASLKETAAEISSIKEAIEKLQKEQPDGWELKEKRLWDDKKQLQEKENKLQEEKNMLLSAQLAGGGAGSLGGAGPNSRMRFVELLRQAGVNKPTSAVLDLIEQRLASRMFVTSRPTLAADLYHAAKLLPGASTERHLFTQLKLVVNGPLYPRAEDGPACLIKAVDFLGRPRVIKMLEPQGGEAKACSVLLRAASSLDPRPPLVDGQLMEMRLTTEHHSPGHGPGKRLALVMPQYCCSVAAIVQLPSSAILLGGRQMVEAVTFIHSQGLVHMDIKGDNMFIDSEGRWWLGDFGSTVPQGEEVTSSSEWFSPENLVGKPAQQKWDWYMLAVALLVELDKGTWVERLIEEDENRQRHVPPHKLKAAAELAPPNLQELLNTIGKNY